MPVPRTEPSPLGMAQVGVRVAAVPFENDMIGPASKPLRNQLIPRAEGQGRDLILTEVGGYR